MDAAQPLNAVFPWVKVVQKEFLRSFPGEYDPKALQFFQNTVEEQVKKVRNRKRRNLLFDTLVEFYSHFCWKIKWDEPSPHMKETCVHLLTNLTKVGIVLSNGDRSSNFCNRVMAAIKMFPGEDNLLYTSLLLVTHLKKKFQDAYGIILKQVLFSSQLVIDKPEVYLKVVLLLRRLISIFKDRSEKTKVRLLASSLKPPHDTLKWLSSCCPNARYGTKVKFLGKKLMSDKLPPESFKNLRQVLLPVLSVKRSTFEVEEKLQQLDSFIIDAVPDGQNDSETLLAEYALPQDHAMHEPLNSEKRKFLSKRKSSLKRKQTEEIPNDSREKRVSRENSVKKVKKPLKTCAENSVHDLKSRNHSVVTESTSQLDFASEISNQSPTSAISDTKNNLRFDKKRKDPYRKKLKYKNLMGDQILFENDLSSEGEQKCGEFDTIESEMDLVTDLNDQNSLINDADMNSKELDADVLDTEHTKHHSIKRKSKRLLNSDSKVEIVTDSVLPDTSSVCHHDKQKSEELYSDVSDEETLIDKPVRKSRLLRIGRTQDSSVDQDGMCHADIEKEKEELNADRLNEEFSSVTKSEQLVSAEYKFDSVSDHLDQDNSVCPIGEKEGIESESDTSSNKESSIHFEPIKGEHLLSTTTKWDHSINQDSLISKDTKKERKELSDDSLPSEEIASDHSDNEHTASIYHGDNDNQKSEDSDTDMLSNKNNLLIRTPVRKSKRLLATEDNMYHSSDQGSNSSYPSDGKPDSREFGAGVLANEKSVVHSPLRKSKRLLIAENAQDNSFDQNSIISDSDYKLGNKEQKKETDKLSNSESLSLHPPIRKSVRFLNAESLQDISVDQDESHVCLGDSKQEVIEELDANMLSSEDLVNVPVRKSKRLLIAENAPDISLDENRIIGTDDSKLGSKKLKKETDKLSNSEPLLARSPIRKSKRFLVAESLQDISVDQDESPVCPGDIRKEVIEELGTNMLSSEELVNVPVRKSKRLLAIESKHNTSVIQDSSICSGDSEQVSKEKDVLSIVELSESSPDHSIDQGVFIFQTNSKQESRELDADMSSNQEESLPVENSKELLAAENAQDHSVDQDCSVCSSDGKPENKEMSSDALSDESSLLHSSTRKSKRLLTAQILQDHAVDASPLTVCSSNNKQESNEFVDASNEKSSGIHVPVRKSKGFCATENKQDSSDCQSVCKKESVEQDSDILPNVESVLIHSLIKKSKMFDSPLDHSDAESSLDADMSNEEASLLHKSVRKSKRLLASKSHSDDQGSSVRLGDNKQKSKELGSDTLCDEESSLSCALARKSKRLLNNESKLDPVENSADQDKCISLTVGVDQVSNETTSDTLPLREYAMINSHSPAIKSEKVIASENNKVCTETDSCDDSVDSKISVKECLIKENFKVVETKTGFKILSNSAEESTPVKKSPISKSFLASSNRIRSSRTSSDLIEVSVTISSDKDSVESTVNSQDVPVVIISPAENVCTSDEYVPSAINNHLLHPSNCEDSHSMSLDEKRPNLGLKREPKDELNVSKNESLHSELPNVCNNSLIKDDPISNPDSLNVRSVQCGTDKILTAVRNTGSSKAAIFKKSACSTITYVPGMTFSPFVRKSKNYKSFLDVSQENKSTKSPASCKLENRIKDESGKFVDYRELENDLCDNKSEIMSDPCDNKSEMSDMVLINPISDDSSVGSDEDSGDGVSVLHTKTEDDDSTGVCSVEQPSNDCSEPAVEAKADLRKLEVSLTSPIAVVDVGKRCDGSSICQKTDDPDTLGEDCVEKTERCDSVQQTLCAELGNATPAQGSVDHPAVVTSAPSTRLQSKRIPQPQNEKSELNPTPDFTGNEVKSKRTAAKPKKGVSTRKTSSRTSTSSSSSLRRSTRKRAQENVPLGFDFMQLSLDSPNAKCEKVASGDDCVANNEDKTVKENNAIPTKRTTRFTLIDSSDSLKEKVETSNNETLNLRRSKRTVVLPAKLKICKL